MAKFDAAIPGQIIMQFEDTRKDLPNVYGEVLQAGAKVVENNLKANMPSSFKKSNIKKCFKTTKIYITPSDGAINVKIGCYGYFKNHLGVVTPAPLVANVFEYGSSKFPKHPFFRKSFNWRQIYDAMVLKELQIFRERLDGKRGPLS